LEIAEEEGITGCSQGGNTGGCHFREGWKDATGFFGKTHFPHEASLLVCYYTGKEKALFKRYTILMVILAAAPLREEKAPGAAAN